MSVHAAHPVSSTAPPPAPAAPAAPAAVLQSVLGALAPTIATKTGVAFMAPTANGGSQLDNAGNGSGEPLNVIISGLSDPRVLTDDGFLTYSQSLGFSYEAFGIHRGTLHTANLGDGNGVQTQKVIYRLDFGLPDVGSLLESLNGGNHFRMWRQNGPTANTGALFLSTSKEEPANENHMVVPNGYDIGRGLLVDFATKGPTKANGFTFSTTAETITGLLPPGAFGVNHRIPTDGKVILLTVKIVSEIFDKLPVKPAPPGGPAKLHLD